MPSRSDNVNYTDRWKSGLGLSAQIQMMRAIQTRQFTGAQTPFGKIGRFWDLRGIHFPDLAQIRGCRFEAIDMSGADLSTLDIEACEFTEVTFDRVNFSAFTDRGNRFDRCSFGHAIFRQAALGFGMSVFAGCVFQRGNFRGAIFKRPEFDQCQFLSCDFRGVDFDASSFVDCAFVGKLNGAWFRGGYGYPELSESYGRARQNNMLRVSWAAAKIWQVTFSDECDLSTVILPTDGKHFRYDRWPERVEAACAKFNDCDNADLGRAYNFVRSFQPHAQSQAWYILNYDDIANLVGNEVAPLVLAAFGDPA